MTVTRAKLQVLASSFVVSVVLGGLLPSAFAVHHGKKCGLTPGPSCFTSCQVFVTGGVWFLCLTDGFTGTCVDEPNEDCSKPPCRGATLQGDPCGCPSTGGC